MGTPRNAASVLRVTPEPLEKLEIELVHAFVSREGASFGDYTPVQTVDFLAEFYPRFDEKRYAKLLQYFQLPEQPVRSMSTGERAKAELAAGVSMGADYMLMDEPFPERMCLRAASS